MMEFQLALKLNPNLAHAYQTYAHFLGNLGRFDEAIAAAQHAKTLDPWSVRISGELGWAFYHAHQYEAAQKEFAELIKLDPYYTSPSTSVIF